MSGVDDRIVSMTFDNENFERNLAATLDSLDALSESLSRVAASENLDGLSHAADSVDLSPIEHAVDNISDRFSVMGAVAFSVIQDLTKNALDFARNVGTKVLDPILTGGKLRATNLEQAKFMFEGLGMDIEAAMDSALKAVEGTAYGLDSAAKAAAQLGGSGLKAGEDMTGALRGIAGIAAMTNTSYDEMADIFISAAGKGKVMSYELARISHRGVNAAAALAKEWGVTEAEVRRMATEGEISFDKFAKGMDAAFGEHATKANETYTGSLANLRAAFSRLGASFFGPHLLQQRDLFNALRPVIDNVHDGLKPLISSFVDMKGLGIKGLIQSLGQLKFENFSKAMMGFAFSFRNIFDVVHSVLDVVKEAFRDIFPKSTTSLLLRFSAGFLELTERIKMGGKTLDQIKSVFRGVFSIVSIGIEVIRVVANTFRDLFSTFAPAVDGGGILEFFANIGESLVRLKESLVEGGGIQEAVGKIILFFMKLRDTIKSPADVIDLLKEKIASLFDRGEVPGAKAASDSLNRIEQRFEMLRNLISKVGDVLSWLGDRFGIITHTLDVVWDHIVTWFSELGSRIAAVMKPGDFNAAVDVVNVGLLGGIAVMLRKFFKDGISLEHFNIIEQLQGVFESLTGALAAMQTELRAKALLKIAAAVAILTVSVVALSLIDSAALTKALTALAVGFGQLIGAMALMEKLSLGTGAAKLSLLAGGMILLSIAATILSVAIKNLSSLGWEELAKGLIGMTVALGAMVLAMNFITSDTSGLIKAAGAMIIIGVALNILALAVKSFAEMSWTEMAKGMIGVASGLALIVGSMHLFPEGKILSTSVAIGAIAVALNILALAVKSFAEMEMEEMGKGMLGIAGALTVIMIAMNLMPDQGRILSSAAAILVLSVAMNAMAVAVGLMGGIPFGELAKGIGAFTVMLAVLAVALNLMTGTAAGAGALVITAGALLIMTQVLKALGELSLVQIAAGLATIAGVFLVLGAGAALLSPLIPSLMGLGIALALIGGAFALFGTGASLVAEALERLAQTGKKGIEVLLDSIDLIVAALPRFVRTLMNSIAEGGAELAKGTGLLLRVLRELLIHILETVTELTPVIAETIGTIISEGLLIMREKFPEFLETGILLLMTFLKGIRDNIGEIITVATEIVVNFSNSLMANAQTLVDTAVNLLMSFLGAITLRASDIVTAGTNLLISFLLGISNEIDRVVTTVSLIVLRFIDSLAQNGIRIINAGFKMLTDLLTGIGDNINDVVETVGKIISEFVTAMFNEAGKISKAGADALEEFLQGIEDDIETVGDAAVSVALKFIEVIGSRTISFADGAFNMLTNFLNDLADVIDRRAPELRGAGRRLAGSIVEGITGGLASEAAKVGSVMGKLARGDIIGATTEALDSNSPSRVFIGIAGDIIDGLVMGIKKGGPDAKESVSDVATNMTDAFERIISQIPDTLSDMDEFNPVITPVLDLTRVQAASRGLNGLMNVSTISPEVSLSKARHISHTTDLVEEEPAEQLMTPSEINFVQNNYSPTALSTSDIYRNTRSQITLAKEELSIP